MASTTDVQPTQGEDPFARINTKWDEWYKGAYYHDDPRKPLVTPPLEPTVEGLEKDIEYHERMMYRCADQGRKVDEAHHAGSTTWFHIDV